MLNGRKERARGSRFVWKTTRRSRLFSALSCLTLCNSSFIWPVSSRQPHLICFWSKTSARSQQQTTRSAMSDWLPHGSCLHDSSASTSVGAAPGWQLRWCKQVRQQEANTTQSALKEVSGLPAALRVALESQDSVSLRLPFVFRIWNLPQNCVL